MSTRPYVWRTAPTGTEGTSTVYVDGYTGSDDFGNGTRTNPYKTLTKAWTAKTTKPQRIICRGVFVEGITDGNHECSIIGDYFGAATIDGQDRFLMYGFGHSNLFLVNMPQPNADMPVVSGSCLLAGVGRANNGNNVGNGGNVYGVAGSTTSSCDTLIFESLFSHAEMRNITTSRGLRVGISGSWPKMQRTR